MKDLAGITISKNALPQPIPAPADVLRYLNLLVV